MTATSQQHSMASSDIFNDDDLPPRGFWADITAVIVRPIPFFETFNAQRMAKHTLWLAILMLAIMAVNTLQMTSQAEDAVPQANDIPAFDDGMTGMDGIPFDPAMMGGETGGDTSSNAGDPVDNWMIALSAVTVQILQWGALTLLLSIVTMFKGYPPRFGLNMQIVIWASLPLALMAILQLAFLSSGGSIAAKGFSGLLSEWPAFANSNIYLQSFIHALASMLTLFAIWSLALVYLGGRLTLRGNFLIVLVVLVIWVGLLGFANSIESYKVLESQLPDEVEILPEGMYPEGYMGEGDMPGGDMFIPENETPEMYPEGHMGEGDMPGGDMFIPEDETPTDGLSETDESTEDIGEPLKIPLVP